jgi:hypothetical protein
VNSPSCKINLLRSCRTVVESGGDPTDPRIVLFEVRGVNITCVVITNVLEPEQFKRIGGATAGTRA